MQVNEVITDKSTEEVRRIQKRLQAVYKARNTSFDALEEKTGISASTIQRYINGNVKKLPMNRLTILAEALGVTPAYIMGWEDCNLEEKTGYEQFINEKHKEFSRSTASSSPSTFDSTSDILANVITKLTSIKDNIPMLTDEEKQLLTLFRQLPDVAKQAVIKFEESFIK